MSGIISGKESSDLYILDGNIRITSEVYGNILNFCREEMKRLGVNYLMEDGSPVHKSKAYCKTRKNLGIEVFLKNKLGQLGSFWPGNSPDLNPNENA